MHRYSYITQYTTIEEIKRAVRDTMLIYAPYATYLGSSKNSIKKRMKYNALVELLAIVDECTDESTTEFMSRVDKLLTNVDINDRHSVYFYINEWVNRNILVRQK